MSASDSNKDWLEAANDLITSGSELIQSTLSIAFSNMTSKRMYSSSATLDGKGAGLLRLVRPSDAGPDMPTMFIGALEFLPNVGNSFITVKLSSISSLAVVGKRLVIISGIKQSITFETPAKCAEAAFAVSNESGVPCAGLDIALIPTAAFDLVALGEWEKFADEMHAGLYVNLRHPVTGLTIMETACTVVHKECRQQLQEAGAIPGRALLLLVQRRDLAGSLALLPYVASFGQDALNLTNEEGNTALHLAVINSLANVVKALILNHGADTNILNSAYKTPAQLAEEGGNRGIIAALSSAAEDADADVSLCVGKAGPNGRKRVIARSRAVPLTAGVGAEFSVRNPMRRVVVCGTPGATGPRRRAAAPASSEGPAPFMSAGSKRRLEGMTEFRARGVDSVARSSKRTRGVAAASSSAADEEEEEEEEGLHGGADDERMAAAGTEEEEDEEEGVEAASSSSSSAAAFGVASSSAAASSAVEEAVESIVSNLESALGGMEEAAEAEEAALQVVPEAGAITADVVITAPEETVTSAIVAMEEEAGGAIVDSIDATAAVVISAAAAAAEVPAAVEAAVPLDSEHHGLDLGTDEGEPMLAPPSPVSSPAAPAAAAVVAAIAAAAQPPPTPISLPPSSSSACGGTPFARRAAAALATSGHGTVNVVVVGTSSASEAAELVAKGTVSSARSMWQQKAAAGAPPTPRRFGAAVRSTAPEV